MKILLIDNFDSFTYNLAHYVEGMHCDVDVIRENDYVAQSGLKYDKIILSPGSGLPQDRDGMLNCIDENRGKRPILGVCLGMQALAERSGGYLYNQEIVKHGVEEEIVRIGESRLLQNVPNEFTVGLYHSWAVNLSHVANWVVTSESKTGICMSIENSVEKLYGVQFHPESILTLQGKMILANFLAQ